MRTLGRRAAWYRNLVVAVAALVLGSVAWALAAGRAWPLAGLLLLLPSCLAFVLNDRRLVRGWRHEILGLARDGGLDLNAFLSVIPEIRTLPGRTLRGMLDVLSRDPASIPDPGVSHAEVPAGPLAAETRPPGSASPAPRSPGR